jgi:hypothetical protein
VTYPTSAQARQRIRRDRIEEAKRRAEVDAIVVFSSGKCSGYGYTGGVHHRNDLGGCANDGGTCLCECHDQTGAS